MAQRTEGLDLGAQFRQGGPVRGLDSSKVVRNSNRGAELPSGGLRQTASAAETLNVNDPKALKISAGSKEPRDAVPRRVVLPRAATNRESEHLQKMILHAASPQRKHSKAAEVSPLRKHSKIAEAGTPTFGNAGARFPQESGLAKVSPSTSQPHASTVMRPGACAIRGGVTKRRPKYDAHMHLGASKQFRNDSLLDRVMRNEMVGLPNVEEMPQGWCANKASSVKLDEEVFRNFWPLLDASRDYARLSGCRFRSRSFDGIGGDDSGVDLVERAVLAARRATSDDSDAKARAAPTVYRFARRLRAGEAALLEELEKAFRIMMAESVRTAMMATCRLLELWPPPPAFAQVADDDCTFEDVSAPLPMIAQRLWNDEQRRMRLIPCEGDADPMRRRAMMAIYIVEFAAAAGAPMPRTPNTYDMMLEEFREKAAEWEQVQDRESSRVSPDSAAHVAPCDEEIGAIDVDPAADGTSSNLGAEPAVSFKEHVLHVFSKLHSQSGNQMVDAEGVADLASRALAAVFGAANSGARDFTNDIAQEA